MLYILVNVLLTTAPTAARDSSSALYDADLRDLSLLPLDKLLAMKRALSYKDIDPPESPANFSGTHAQALRGDPGTRGSPPPRRGGPPPEVWVEGADPWKGAGGGGGGGKGKGALQGIFQGTVTVLAFLAFGGYLVCLIINSLKQKEAALEMTLLTTVVPPARVRRTPPPPLDTTPSAERMYATMRSLAEAYAKYNRRCLHH